ncbi:FAD-binding protein [Mycobacterium yunnanensis]|uniref:FAD-binding protein n=1 Tax=Mycobacterium yunnanensis TaxID=368477 RepID=A0A9X3BWZ3_9MYCO|nr:FAD-binding protein [Mycobacterium yunnanensis]MCV7424805.1 FAD-binding protein [Mycobacterium yunnanensis]
MWDIEVDVAVIGAGLGGLANAIAVVDAGGEVLVAASLSDDEAVSQTGAPVAPPDLRRLGDSPSGALRELVGAKRGWLVHDGSDAETAEYLADVADCVLDAPVDAGDGRVPRRNARNLSREEAFNSPVETFFGSKLAGWAAQCIASPFGLMYTNMRDWRTTTMVSESGESVEALSIGTIEWADGCDRRALHGWMAAQARDRDVEVEYGSTLDRIVFEEGDITGVILRTPDGPLAVRTRAGLTFAPADRDPVVAEHPVAPGDLFQVCLVGRTASRFGRVELMATEPEAPSRPVCTGSRRQVREGLHDARQQHLDGWRCGKVNRYPALGQ